VTNDAFGFEVFSIIFYSWVW